MSNVTIQTFEKRKRTDRLATWTARIVLGSICAVFLSGALFVAVATVVAITDLVGG